MSVQRLLLKVPSVSPTYFFILFSNESSLNADSLEEMPCSRFSTIFEMVEKRLQGISSNESAFNEAKPPYEEALKKSGYNTTLVYSNNQNTTRPQE